jgi:hypothetical protein
MQFTRFPDRCTTGGTTHGVYLLQSEFLGFHSVVVFLCGTHACVRFSARKCASALLVGGHYIPRDGHFAKGTGEDRGKPDPLS